MSPDENLDPREAERRKLLEEIRQRAEEAELRRIEAEEDSSDDDADQPERQNVRPSVAVEPPPPPPSRVTPEHSPEDEHRLIDLRGRFAVAIDRKNLDQAADIILDLAELIPETVELTSYQNKIRALRKELKEQKETPEPPSRRAEPSEKERLALEKKISTLMEQSVSLYEQEKYEKAASTVAQLLEVDPGNEEARDLGSRIDRARELAAEVRAEEERLKAEEGAAAVEEPEPEPEKGKDFWGSKEAAQGEAENGLTVDEDAEPQAPPKPPLAQRLTRRLSGVSIPVKPILLTATMILAIVGGYYVAREIQMAAAEMDSSVLVLPGWHEPSDTLAAYLSFGILERMISDLSSVSDLRVIAAPSASSVQYLRGGPAAAARDLRVRYYVHWNIATTPASVSLELTLRDTSAVDPVWTIRKQSSIRELSAVADEVAGSILSSMELEDQETSRSGANSGMSANPDALLDYFRGRYMLAHPERYPVRSAGMSFGRALTTDPGFRVAKVSRAWALLREAEESVQSPASLITDASRLLASAGDEGAASGSYLAAYGLSEQMQGRFDKAMSLFDTGMKFYPADPEMYRRAAMVALIRGEEDRARMLAERAIELDPLNAQSFLVRGHVLRNDDPREALRDVQRAVRLSHNPGRVAAAYLPEMFVATQQHDSAAAILDNEIARSREDHENYYRQARVYQAAGKPIAAWTELLNRAGSLISRRLAATPEDGVARSYLALVLTRLGKQKDAEIELTRALRDTRDNPLVFYHAARAYAMQRNENAALEQLDRALGLRYSVEMISDMDFFNLRDQSSFAAVVLR